MSVTDRILSALTTVMRMNDKVEERAGLMKEHQRRLDDRRLGPETRGLFSARPFLVSLASIREVAIQDR